MIFYKIFINIFHDFYKVNKIILKNYKISVDNIFNVFIKFNSLHLYFKPIKYCPQPKKKTASTELIGSWTKEKIRKFIITIEVTITCVVPCHCNFNNISGEISSIKLKEPLVPY